MFGEVQSALNAIWKAEPKEPVVSRLVRARLAKIDPNVTAPLEALTLLAELKKLCQDK